MIAESTTAQVYRETWTYLKALRTGDEIEQMAASTGLSELLPKLNNRHPTMHARVMTALRSYNNAKILASGQLVS